MRFKLLAAACALGLALAGQAFGQSWTQVSTDPVRDSFDLDMSSITANGGFTQVWVRQTLAKPQRDAISGKTYTNVVMRRLEDCRAKTFALTMYVYRNDKGEVLSNTPVPQNDWKFVSPPPGSIAAGLQAKICEVAAARTALKPSVETGPTTQTTWLPSAYDPSTQTRYFIQQDSVVLLEADVVGLIAKADLGTPRKLPDGSMAVAGFLMQAFDCKAKTAVVLSADSYDAAENLVGVYEPPEDKMTVQAFTPGSASELMAKYACDPAHIVHKAEAEGGTYVGTGWLGPKGYLITANHVIEGATKLELAYDGKMVGTAEVVVTDPANDIAILKPILTGPRHPIIPFHTAPVHLGDRVFTLGYPAPDVLGMALKMTSGEVSAMSGNDAASGRMDDARFMQVSIPIHSGNSGGPVIDSQGQAVGIVISKMNKTGDDEVAQNVNYALKIGYVRSLMAELPTLGQPAPATPRPSLSALVAELQGSVFLVIATR
jgi:S1-C subfamily serine protease